MQIVKRLSSYFTLFFYCSLLLLSSCQSNVVIVNELEEKDANEIIVFLASYNISATKTANIASAGSTTTTWNIGVATGNKMRALSLLNMNGLPRRRSENLLNLFQKQGLVSSEMEEKIRYRAGLAEQIAGTIRKIDGVLDADVQISFPEEESIPGQATGQKKVVTASVYIKHQGVLDNPNSHLIMKIKRLVSSSIQGLEFDNVEVIPDRAIFSEPMLRNTTGPEINSVWGIRTVSDSVARLQTFFFTLLSLAVTFFLMSGWLLWKLHKILGSLGGWKSLLKVSPWIPQTESDMNDSQDEESEETSDEEESDEEEESERDGEEEESDEDEEESSK